MQGCRGRWVCLGSGSPPSMWGQEPGRGGVGGVADYCGPSWRQQDHNLDLTQRGLCRAHHRASPPRPPQISNRTLQTRPCWEQLGGFPSLGTLP